MQLPWEAGMQKWLVISREFLPWGKRQAFLAYNTANVPDSSLSLKMLVLLYLTGNKWYADNFAVVTPPSCVLDVGEWLDTVRGRAFDLYYFHPPPPLLWFVRVKVWPVSGYRIRYICSVGLFLFLVNEKDI